MPSELLTTMLTLSGVAQPKGQKMNYTVRYHYPYGRTEESGLYASKSEAQLNANLANSQSITDHNGFSWHAEVVTPEDELRDHLYRAAHHLHSAWERAGYPLRNELGYLADKVCDTLENLS
jgi:hypothetical protein